MVRIECARAGHDRPAHGEAPLLLEHQRGRSRQRGGRRVASRGSHASARPEERRDEPQPTRRGKGSRPHERHFLRDLPKNSVSLFMAASTYLGTQYVSMCVAPSILKSSLSFVPVALANASSSCTGCRPCCRRS